MKLPNGKYKCTRLNEDGSECGRIYDKPQSLGAHVVAFHRVMGEEILRYMMGERAEWRKEGKLCPWGCGERFYSPNRLVRHIMTVHKTQVEAKIAELKVKKE